MPLTRERETEILGCFYRVGRVGALRLADGGGPFGFDIHAAVIVEELVAAYRPTAIVETGCYLGDTTTYLAAAYPDRPILTCDIDKTSARFTAQRVRDASHVEVEHLDSPELVAYAADRYSPALYFLDAHWGDDWPLIRELQAAGNGVVVIHDFDIGHSRFGYDEYGGVRCGPDLLAQVPDLAGTYFTSNPDSDYPLPCLQVGRRTGLGIVPIGVETGPLDENPHLIRHSLSSSRDTETVTT